MVCSPKVIAKNDHLFTCRIAGLLSTGFNIVIAFFASSLVIGICALLHVAKHVPKIVPLTQICGFDGKRSLTVMLHVLHMLCTRGRRPFPLSTLTASFIFGWYDCIPTISIFWRLKWLLSGLSYCGCPPYLSWKL